MVGLFLYLLLAFQFWMMFDALRRRAGLGWLLLILIPLGAVVYFFLVKTRELNVMPAVERPEKEAVDLDALRNVAQVSPSFHNRVTLGRALLDAKQSQEALTLFEQALQTHPGDKEGMLGRGTALLQLGKPEEALEPLSEVVDRNFAFRDYRAARTLVQALYAADDVDAALEVAQMIARKSERYEHKLALAELQRQAARDQDAVATLRALIAEFEAEPDYVRRRYGALFTEARRLLRSLHPNTQ